MLELLGLGLLLVLAITSICMDVAHRKPPKRYNLRNPVYGVPKNVKWEDGKPYTTE